MEINDENELFHLESNLLQVVQGEHHLIIHTRSLSTRIRVASMNNHLTILAHFIYHFEPLVVPEIGVGCPSVKFT